MDYEVFQNEIVARLQPLLAVGISAVRLPETESERTKPQPTNAKFTVIYAGSEYEGSSSTAQNRNIEKVFVQLLIESTFLYGNKGIYSLINIAKKSLSGFKPSNCQRLEPVKHHSLGNDEVEKINNMWNYQMIFQTTTVSVEDFQEDLSLILSQITLLDGNDETIIPQP